MHVGHRIRRRDRRGRGLRGPLAGRGPLTPHGVPLERSRAERFDELVLDAVERLERRWAEELRGVEFGVEDIPTPEPSTWDGEQVPLGRAHPAAGAAPARVIVYRRPMETRAREQRELAALVHDVVVEQVAELLGLDPRTVDPGYDGPDSPSGDGD